MRFAAIFATAALAAFASAQNATAATVSTTSVAPASTQSQQMPPIATAGFNPNNVSSSDKADWCRGQRNSCPAICGGGYSVNSCDETALTYDCVCYNGTVPDCTRYQQTLPFFICERTFDQCIASHPDDLTGQRTCQSNAQCATMLPPQAAVATTTTSSASAATSGSATRTSASAAATTTTPNAAVIHGAQVSTGAFAALLMALFKLLL